MSVYEYHALNLRAISHARAAGLPFSLIGSPTIQRQTQRLVALYY